MSYLSDNEILKLYEVLKISAIESQTIKNLIPITSKNEIGWSIIITTNTDGMELTNG